MLHISKLSPMPTALATPVNNLGTLNASPLMAKSHSSIPVAYSHVNCSNPTIAAVNLLPGTLKILEDARIQTPADLLDLSCAT